MGIIEKMLQVVKNYYHLLQAITANVAYGFPSKKLKVIAITGTDGKTTTTTLLYYMLKTAGYKVALISTVAAYIGDEEVDTGFHVTTPSPFSLQSLLRKVANKKIEYVILETTSHGIDQNRIWGITPFIAAVTNVTHEHLDYHKSFQKYLDTKARLLVRAKHAYLNQDAKESFSLVEDHVRAHGFTKNQAGEIEADEKAQTYTVISSKQLSNRLKRVVVERFGSQQYNFENVALAGAIATKTGASEKQLVQAIREFPGVPGRMQEVARYKGIKIIVDFAHTPNALENALSSVVHKPGRVIVVFGCAGLRDHTKRPLMGEVASRIADLCVLTAEDPRTEDVWAIIAQIKSGIPVGNHGKIISIPDRFDAISFAIKELAHSGDVILITGKGHEKSMCYGTTEYPWNDKEAVLTVLG